MTRRFASAYIVDPRTIDYLIAWVHAHPDAPGLHTLCFWPRLSEIPEHLLRGATGCDEYGWRLDLARADPSDLGAILMAENVKSVRTRYPHDSADDLPGPVDQRRVWRYMYWPIPQALDPTWVIKAADCLYYQSCESETWTESLAHSVVYAIRESAIAAVTKDAPWGITPADIHRV